MQLEEAEKRLKETERKLAHIRNRGNAIPSTKHSESGVKVKEERRSCSPIKTSEHSRNGKHDQRPQLVIPAVNPKLSVPIKIEESGTKSISSHGKSNVKERGSRIPSDKEDAETQSRGTKRKFGTICHFL